MSAAPAITADAAPAAKAGKITAGAVANVKAWLTEPRYAEYAAQVAEQSLLCWPNDTASLLSVPVVYAADVEGTIEVVDRRGRRSTEWEIALLQVVAARVAGLAHDQGYADSAVA